MTDQHDPDEPITPEVVRPRGAAARKRRGPEPAGGEPADPSDVGTDEPRPAARVGNIVRWGCMVLIGFGVIQVFATAPMIIDPDAARCAAARSQVDVFNDDDEEFNDIALPDGIEEAADLECAEALELAVSVPAEEGDEPPDEFPPASQYRFLGIGISVLGLAQAATGFLTMRTLRRGFRTAAAVTTGLSIVFPVLLPVISFLALILPVFVVYALLFSRDAKAIWGGGGFLRPRPAAGGGRAGE